MPIQPRAPILRLNSASKPPQERPRCWGVRFAISRPRKARTSPRKLSACGECGGGAVNDVVEKLRGDTAEADHQYRSEEFVAHAADDDLDARSCHRAHEDALNGCIRPHCLELCEHRPVARTCARRIGNRELHPT